MNVQEQIRSFEASHTAKHERMKMIMQGAADDGVRTLNEAEQQEYDDLSVEVAQVAEHLKRLRGLERTVLPAAKPVAGGSADDAMMVRSGSIITAGRSQVPKGTAFTRYLAAMALSRQNLDHAIRISRRWRDSTPEVEKYLQTKADVGTTTDTDWAAPLVEPATLVSEFLELLTPKTILGRLNLNTVPFNTRIVVETGEPLVGWVGEGGVKPVGQSSYEQMTLGYTKAAGIVVITEELARLSTPSAEQTLRNRLVKTIAKFLDEQLLDPAVTATSANPASLTQGVTPVTASGTDVQALLCDVGTMLANLVVENLSASDVVLVMSDVLATQIGLLTNALGQTPTNVSVGANGGTIAGLPVITSQNVPGDTSGSLIVAIKQSEVFLADDGGVSVDASREATLALDGGATAAHSLWQRNEIALRAERWVHWKKARAAAVQYISGAAYNSCGS